jgi:arginine-tRNA-protein transferase
MESDDELNGGAMTQLQIAGPSKHDCGYCKGTDTSISFGLWSEQMTCKVRLVYSLSYSI